MSPKSEPFNIQRLQDRRLRIYSACRDVDHLTGQILDPDTFGELIDTLRQALRLKLSYDHVLRDSLLEFAGIELTDSVYDRIAVKLAGGYDKLRKGVAIHGSNGVPSGGLWSPVQIAEMRFDEIKGGKVYVKMTSLVMAGPLAGRMFSQIMTAKAAVTVVAITLGWPKWGVWPAHSELVQMFFNGKIVNDKFGPQIDEFKCTATQLKLNKTLRDSRDEPCIRDHRYQCKTCPIGYNGFDGCMRGTHRYTWVTRECPTCKDPRAIYDPAEANAKECLACRSRQARAMWTQARHEMA